MRKSTVLLAAALLSFAGIAAGAESEPIRFYDLTYAARIDLNDSEQVRTAWDHCHVVAALQGIVNRSEPRLYVRFVQSPHFDLLKTPTWYARVVEQMERLDPKVELLDAPTFFELYRVHLEGKD